MKTETITWNELPFDGMPDAETTVLLSTEEQGVNSGWFDGTDWRWCESGGIVGEPVQAWADIPKGIIRAEQLRELLAAPQAEPQQAQGIPAEVLPGWKFNHAQEVDSDGVWALGWRDPEDGVFAPFVEVDTGEYFQPKDAEPLARAILARLSAAPAPQQTQGVSTGMAQAMKDAIEGECDGLAITDANAKAILKYVFASAPQDEPLWKSMGAISAEQWEKFKAWQRTEGQGAVASCVQGLLNVLTEDGAR